MLADKEFLESLLSYIGKKLKHEVEGLLIGGNAMLYYGLKEQTKDLDIVLFNRKDMTGIIQIIKNHPIYKKARVLTQLPYEIKPELKKKGEPTVISDGDIPRFDLFYKFVFSVDVKKFFDETKRSIRFELLKLRIIDPEGLIFLKAVTGRPVDVEDIIRIVKNLEVDWKRLLNNIKEYYKIDRRPVWFILGTFFDINQKEGIIPKFLLEDIAKLFDVKL
jgi:hypothetical protein